MMASKKVRQTTFCCVTSRTWPSPSYSVAVLVGTSRPIGLSRWVKVTVSSR
jgi:hypothetical protein